jgi:hypothetical protein
LAAAKGGAFDKKHSRYHSAGSAILHLDLDQPDHQHLAVALIFAAAHDSNCPDDLKAELEPVCEAPLARRNRILRKQGDNSDLLGAIDDDLARTHRIATLTREDAYAGLEALIEAANIKHPRLGLRLGHLGSTKLFGGGNGGDEERSWYIFTKIASANVQGYKFGGYGDDKLPALLVDAEERLDDWLCHLDAELASGRCHQIP